MIGRSTLRLLQFGKSLVTDLESVSIDRSVCLGHTLSASDIGSDILLMREDDK